MHFSLILRAGLVGRIVVLFPRHSLVNSQESVGLDSDGNWTPQGFGMVVAWYVARNE